MKYIITESQYKNIILGYIPPFIRRRLEELDDMVIDEEINQPTLCDDFISSDKYADHVLKNAIMEFMESNEDRFPDFMNSEKQYGISLKNIVYEKHYGRLLKIYNETCDLYNS